MIVLAQLKADINDEKVGVKRSKCLIIDKVIK